MNTNFQNHDYLDETHQKHHRAPTEASAQWWGILLLFLIILLAIVLRSL